MEVNLSLNITRKILLFSMKLEQLLFSLNFHFDYQSNIFSALKRSFDWNSTHWHILKINMVCRDSRVETSTFNSDSWILTSNLSFFILHFLPNNFPYLITSSTIFPFILSRVGLAFGSDQLTKIQTIFKIPYLFYLLNNNECWKELELIWK